jgi:iron complex outermembrane receptor protein
MARLGFRADARLNADSDVTMQAEGYMGRVGQVDPSLTLSNVPPPTVPLEVDVAGGFVNASWTRRFGARADLVVRATYDRTHRDDPTYRDTLDVVDLGSKTTIQLPGANELVMGANYRVMNDEFRGKGVAELRPATSMDHLVSGFAQDTLSLFDGVLRITAGAKLEHNDFSGVEFQPAVRVAVSPAAAHTTWAALSRAVRVPTRIERDIFAEAATPGQPTVQLVGNPELSSEELVAAELGHRWRALPNLLFDLAGYHFRYDSLIGYEIGTVMQEGEEVIVPVLNRNAMHGHSSGGELAVLWSPLAIWQLTATYSHCRMELEPDSDAMDPTNAQNIERQTPRHQGSLRSSVDLPGGFQLDGFGRLVGRTNRADPVPAVPRYLGLDARLAWRATEQIELSVVGQNLIDNHKLEFPGGTEVERSFFGKVAGRF